MIRFWLIYRKEDALRNKAYIEMYQRYAPEYGLECELVYVEDIKYGVQNGVPYLSWNHCEDKETAGLFRSVGKSYDDNCRNGFPDFAIVRAILPSMNKQLELLGIPCLNNYQVSSICNDKAECYRYLSGKGISMPDTLFVANMERFPLIGCHPIEAIFLIIQNDIILLDRQVSFVLILAVPFLRLITMLG